MLSMIKSFKVRNRVNDCQNVNGLSTNNRSSYLESAYYIDNTFKNIKTGNFLPLIYQKSETNNLNENKNNRDEKRKSQNNNVNNNKSEENSKNENYQEENCRSQIFILEKSTNKIFVLAFKATDVSLSPIYLKRRAFVGNDNDKCIQPKSSVFYENAYNKKASRFNQILKTYKIAKSSKNNEKLSIMSFKKPIFTKRPTYPANPKPKPSVSDTESNLKQSMIYLSYKNVDYKINPGLMILRSSMVIDFEAEQRRIKLLTDLNMQLPSDSRNKALIIAKYKGDILKFQFSLFDINCKRLKVTSSIGVMAKDENVYIKDFSPISNRKIYISVPKSNYEYDDVMVKLRNRNKTMKFNKIDPIWLVEQRKKRFKEYFRCRRKNPYDDLLELKIGSNLSYESFNCINKVKGGTAPCSVTEETYEKWVQSIQLYHSTPSDDVEKESGEIMFTDSVQNWNLVMNTT